jgi:zinc-ribbon domain
MRFLRRKSTKDDEPERCPNCREPVPDGAIECMMCGATLESLRPMPRSEETELSKATSPDG